MFHESCEVNNVNALCMTDDKCFKRYSRKFCEKMKITLNNDTFVTRDDYTFINQYIVSYNSYLCIKYNCHINVEIANNILIIKYLYKYVYKNHDRTCISMYKDDSTFVIDEIQNYLNVKYVFTVEMC